MNLKGERELREKKYKLSLKEISEQGNILSNKYVRQMVNILNTERALVNHQKKKPSPQIHTKSKRHKQAEKKSVQIVKKYTFWNAYSTNTSQINAKSNQNILLSLSIL